MGADTWTGAAGSGDWFTDGNWNTGVPDATTNVNINSGFVTVPQSIGAVKSIANFGSGSLDFENAGASTVTNYVVNFGSLFLDFLGGAGGSSLAIGANLNNWGIMEIGNGALSSPDEIVAASLRNTGTIALAGAEDNSSQALLDVTGGVTGSVAGFGAAGILTGNVSLTGDSAIEFATGQISKIAANATLTLDGGYIEDSAIALGSNSALSGLTTVGRDGALNVSGLSSLSTNGDLTNSGDLTVFVESAISGGQGVGPGLTVGGSLTNLGQMHIAAPSIAGESATCTVVATSIVNSGNGVVLTVSSATDTGQSVLDVTDGITNTGGGRIAIDPNSVVTAAFVSQVNWGRIFVNDSVLNVSGDFTIGAGTAVEIDAFGIHGHYGDGGSTVTIDGALTNAEQLEIGNLGLRSSDSVTAATLDNTGTIVLEGQTWRHAALDVFGQITNNGVVSITSDSEELGGAIAGVGALNLNAGSTLTLDSSIASGQTITYSGTDKLVLALASSFDATIAGFGTGDRIDTTSFVRATTTLNYVPNAGDAGGTLTLTDGVQVANFLMTGVYTNTDFKLSADSSGGTFVKFV